MRIFHRSAQSSPKKNWKIKKPVLDLIFECAKSSYPQEFGGLLRIDTELTDTIVELILLPGTIAGDTHAIFRMHMRPIDFSIVGTIHSHPSPSPYPSAADLELFSKYGRIHIIAAKPFDMTSWKAYDYQGREVALSVV